MSLFTTDIKQDPIRATSKTNDHNKSQIQRHLSVYVSTSFTKGIAHTEVLEEIEKLVEKNLIQSIQITKKNCIVTVLDPDTKHILLTRGIEIRNRYIKFVDVEKQVTNITIKDAPCELSNLVICAFMQIFGDVVQGSLRRGMIKGTNIETGTRYMQLTNYCYICNLLLYINEFYISVSIRLVDIMCLVSGSKTVTIQFFSVICMDCIKCFSTSFSISSKTSVCAIPFVKLVLKCTDKCLWI
jgi:hypothetical protein